MQVEKCSDQERRHPYLACAGLPRVIHVDNGKDFHSDALVRGCQEYGIRLVQPAVPMPKVLALRHVSPQEAAA